MTAWGWSFTTPKHAVARTAAVVIYTFITVSIQQMRGFGSPSRDLCVFCLLSLTRYCFSASLFRSRSNAREEKHQTSCWGYTGDRWHQSKHTPHCASAATVLSRFAICYHPPHLCSGTLSSRARRYHARPKPIQIIPAVNVTGIGLRSRCRSTGPSATARTCCRLLI